MPGDSFEVMLAAAIKALSVIGTGALRAPEICREGARTYQVGRLGRLGELKQQPALSDLPPATRPRHMNIFPSNICSALDLAGVIGSKVINAEEFLVVLMKAVAAHDFSKDRIPGQAYLVLPDAIPFVSSGVGHRQPGAESYVLREYRGRVNAFLRRECAAPVTECAVVVYTMQAYLDDPDVTPAEISRITELALLGSELAGSDTTYVIVAVLASSGGPSRLSPHRFTANLAGGNHEAQVWTADEIREKAQEIMRYENEWTTVADAV